MKRRFISSALAMLMLLTTLMAASCGKEETTDGTLQIDGDDAAPLTLTI